MTTIEHGARTPASTILKIAARRAAEAMLSFLRAVRNRRQVYNLGNLTDTELADIGLTRADLHVAIASPLGVDPTSTLGAMARARMDGIEEMARRVN